jgi:2-(1,2-epoxy-1,2-dihydrophenyl)acetyl-CoA isomerase
MSDTVVMELRDGILLVRLNRPDAYNAWTADMRDLMSDRLEKAQRQEEVRAFVLT